MWLRRNALQYPRSLPLTCLPPPPLKPQLIRSSARVAGLGAPQRLTASSLTA